MLRAALVEYLAALFPKRIHENNGMNKRDAYSACILFDVYFYDTSDCKNTNLFILIPIKN